MSEHAPEDELRRRAEERLKDVKQAGDAEGDSERLLQELLIHQAELEIQNEELRRARQELEESSRKYADLYHNAPVGYVTLDQGIMTEANLTAARLLGVDRGSLVRTVFSTWLAPADRQTFYAHLREVVQEGRPAACEVKLRQEAPPVYLRLESIPAGEAGKAVCRTTLHDITGRRQAEEELRRTLAELGRSNQELERFAYIASHDLREPLRTITGFLTLLQRRYQDRLDDSGKEFIGFAVEGAERLDRMILDLLDYSRLQRQEIELRPVELSGVWLAATGRFKGLLEETAARITHDPLPVVLGKEDQLVRLFQNLLANALTYRGDRRPEIHLGAERREGEWLLSVRDNGIGFKPRYGERIFQVFQRLHTQQEYPGTGIGLAVCKKIVERHGGRIWAESEPGEGTTVYLTLPAADN